LEKIEFNHSCRSSIRYLNLSGTKINDDLFKDINLLSQLKILVLQDCTNLVSPTIELENLEDINLCYATNLEKITIKSPNVMKLDLRHTSITDTSFAEGISNQPMKQKLKYLLLSGCNKLQNLEITDFPSLETLFLSYCDLLDNPVISNLSSISFIDLRLSKVKEDVFTKIVETCKSLKVLLYGDGVDNNFLNDVNLQKVE
jgi:Leucine-rich repeat (LRR) protein